MATGKLHLLYHMWLHGDTCKTPTSETTRLVAADAGLYLVLRALLHKSMEAFLLSSNLAGTGWILDQMPSEQASHDGGTEGLLQNRIGLPSSAGCCLSGWEK